MKRASLLLVRLLCFSVLVFAGEVITNDTGEDATGLRVAFSTPVLITAFGDILTSVDPQMLAFEFVFSGGTVEPWGSHWFNYAPTTASVVESEWLTELRPPCPDTWWEEDQIWCVTRSLAMKHVQLLSNPLVAESMANELGLFQSVGLDVASWNAITWSADWKEAFTSHTEEIHNMGGKVIGTGVGTVSRYEHPSLFLEDMAPAALIDPFGNTLRDTQFGAGAPMHSCLHPITQAFILQLLKDHIDCGSDGVTIDDLAYGSTFYPDFNPHTLSLFNDYLKIQYSASELQTLAMREGFASFSEFDYAAVVRNVLDDDWQAILTHHDWGYIRGDYEIPLSGDYIRFVRLGNKCFAEWLITEIKDYALETQDKCIPVSANINDFTAPEAFMIVALLDYVDLEWHYYENGYPPSARAFPTLRVAQAFDKRGMLLTDLETQPDLRERGPERSTTLLRTLIADAYAGDGVFYVEEGIRDLHFDMEALLPSWTFVKSRPFLFAEAERAPGSVAILQLYESLDVYMSTDYKGLCHLLADLGYQFSTLVGSVDDLVPHRLTLPDLEQFEVVLIPELRWLEDAHASLLLRYIENGGKVIVFAAPDVMDWGRPAMAERMFDLLKRGATSNGNGTLVHVDNLIGSDYIANPSDTERDRLLALLTSLGMLPEVQFSSPSLVSAFEYDGDNSAIVHFVNYDYDPLLDQTQAFLSQAVSVSVPELA
ncbi:hypothetical protein KAH43_03685, partial [Candidatus Bipolaricaulota bacterium]|nr:hypothetical protein [Candidatus Bipolaricaulota bacterium]